MRGVSKPRDERNPHDQYFTPQTVANDICNALRALGIAPTRILVPGAGEGAFLRASAAAWPGAQILGLDIDPKLAGIVQCDFLKIVNPSPTYSLAVGNPPFDLAEEFVRAAMEHVHDRGRVAFILRLGIIEWNPDTGLRFDFWKWRSLRWVIPMKRPSFAVNGKKDASAYATFVWEKGYRGDARIRPHLEMEPK